MAEERTELDRERWTRLKARFLEAVQIPRENREEFLDKLCDEDPGLIAELRELLHEHEAGEAFMRPRWLPELADFEILRELGSGGMGVVYLARQVSLGRLVALKVMRNHLGATPRQVHDFRREPAKAANLRHPGIVTVHAIGPESEVPYFVMDYIPGRSLRELLQPQGAEAPADRGAGDGPHFGEREKGYFARVAQVVAEVAEALQCAHEEGIAHRDIKPANIIIDATGHPHLVDFGLAKDLTAETLTSRVIGTPFYMSPEQARIHEVELDHRTDVYSLGVVMYEMLTFTRAFERETYTQVLEAIRTYDPPRVRRANRDVPLPLETICHKAIRKDPGQRYQSAGALAADLRAFLDHRPIQARPPTLVEVVVSRWHRHRKLAAVAAVLVIAVFAALELAASWQREAEFLRLPVPETFAQLASSNSGNRERVELIESTRNRIAALRERYGELPEVQQLRVARLEQELQALAGEVVAGLSATIGALLRGSGPAGPDFPELARNHALLERVTAALPEGGDSRPRAILDSFRPRLSVTSDPPGAEVFVYGVHPQTGVAVAGAVKKRIGVTPLEAVPVDAGYVRIEVVDSTGRFGEFTAMLSGFAGVYQVPPLRLRRLDEVVNGMVRIPAGPLRHQSPAAAARPGVDGYPKIPPVVELPGFYVDTHEVTNGEYRAFCAATGRAVPEQWPPLEEWRPEWDALPVAWVDVYDARAYAAWAGKRLPSEMEWDRAARGATGWRYPWADESTEEETARRSNVGGQGRKIGADWAGYVAAASPVGSRPAGASPDGIEEVMGNVMEWTDTPAMVQVQEGRWMPGAGHRLVKGSSFRVGPRPLYGASMVASASKDQGIGFRCVKSIRD